MGIVRHRSPFFFGLRKKEGKAIALRIGMISAPLRQDHALVDDMQAGISIKSIPTNVNARNM